MNIIEKIDKYLLNEDKEAIKKQIDTLEKEVERVKDLHSSSTAEYTPVYRTAITDRISSLQNKIKALQQKLKTMKESEELDEAEDKEHEIQRLENFIRDAMKMDTGTGKVKSKADIKKLALIRKDVKPSYFEEAWDNLEKDKYFKKHLSKGLDKYSWKG